MSRDGQHRTEPGDIVGDPEIGYRQVVQVWRGEDIGRFTDAAWFRGTHAAACMGKGWTRALSAAERGGK